MTYIAERRAEEKDRRRGEILDAAAAVAADLGIESLTMDRVGERARVSRALLYVYFKDKGDLCLGLCDRGIEKLNERFSQVASLPRTGIEQIGDMGRAYVSFAQEFPVHFEAMCRYESSGRQSPDRERNVLACANGSERIYQLMIGAIERGQQDGSIATDTGPPRLIAVTLWGFMHGVVQLAKFKELTLTAHGVTSRMVTEMAFSLARRGLSVLEVR
jgi:TetR/AcrR family transcriptional regulator